MKKLEWPLVLLAAGSSDRTMESVGLPKGLLTYENKPWLAAQIDTFANLGGHKAVIVLGHHRIDYEEAMPWLSAARDGWYHIGDLSLMVVINDEPEFGPFSSLRVGLAALEKKLPGSSTYVMPLDVPCPRSEVWYEMELNARVPAADAIVPTFEQRAGHPVLLTPTFMRHTLTVPMTHHAARLDRQIALSAERGRVRYVATNDQRCVMNLNTIEQLNAFGVGVHESRG